jgi:hypothetical protein
MLNRKELSWLLIAAYVWFAQWASTWWSKLPLCVLVSENQTADNNTDQQACASLFEGITRLFRFLWESANHENVLAFGTVLIAVFTLTLWRSTRALWEAGERQLRLIEAFSGRQASDTRLLQRAYLSVEPVRVVRMVIPPDQAVAHIGIKNVGNLPARNVSWIIRFRIDAAGGRTDFPINRTEAEGDNVVTPGTTMIQGSGPIATRTIRPFGEPSPFLYVWGAVFYDDGFRGEMRTTLFCHRYNTIGWNGEELPSTFARYHQSGNQAD